ncbi:MAG: 3-isopropylmalate dehydratase small subunit [Chloroflexi bacterium]|jgi:3-isopropylmalate/(R)-2-methylmalate dehydratase small subunit|nr:3-isopropylmalate dehydratase small subunit [Dehalococcoidia bacterium]PKB83687.1 MAG: 3-isopropylmalate dehydratase small subunit [SAR202 cluster bacterium MP-SInd-SRR3963457-G1]PKB85425.1 MAG: 3-isopropylmalate dehydratase small subunit [SAR202 cluster bacterium MP-NPac-SRR3961935-G1]RUA21571.1 MAG: 3-isopropylmalate dehydratase small subunit [Chloroflexota bacterium]RUA31863.1 MAG: 3-isopropylmalate dehydratase small subunit [Chloroflexota bacterium]|tara:strand:+ start:2572 stop:3165 length:594 start_codon:yes stop_codon:yes gene_type:complete
MDVFTKLTGVVAPIDRINIDTDQIIPAVFLKSIERSGFEDALFSSWRYNADGSPNPDFVLNKPAYKNANVLVAGPNFGCGSSREHAPWALRDYGIKCIISTSFADIFYNNCFKNGVLPLVLPAEQVREIMDKAESDPGIELNVDLVSQRVWDESEEISITFEIDAARKDALVNGLDDIGLTLRMEQDITDFESKHGL